MTRQRTAAPTRQLRMVAASTRLLLDGWIAPAEIETAHVDRCLLDAASAVLAQLQLLGELWQGSERPAHRVVGIVDLAESFQTATPGAIGASGVLVDHLRDPSAARLAGVLDSARRTFDDDDLIAGATALLAATTVYLADAVGVPQTEVHDEVHRAFGRRRSRIDRHRYCREGGAGRRGSRPES